MFTCNQCGRCCREICIDVYMADILRWLKEERYDILSHISYIDNYPVNGIGGFYILETVLNPKRACPFLIDNKCSIHDTKPMVCKDAPFGYDKFPICPSFNKKEMDKKDRNFIKNKHREEIKTTYMNRDKLLNILMGARCHGKCNSIS